MAYPQHRPRRLRRSPALRQVGRETDVLPRHLVAPLFVKQGITEAQAIPSMPGHWQHTLESLAKQARNLYSKGIRSFLVFGIPSVKDPTGSQAYDPKGVAQSALTRLRGELGDDAVVIADLCLCEYTDHGHCGVLQSGTVSNDATLELYARTAVAQATAGADMVAPSGMMDGQVAAIRQALDDEGFEQVAIMAYAAKYSSALYGPFRDAAECAPQEGDRSSYQMDPANVREAVREALLDEAEGADIVMVKPALAYLDVISQVRDASMVPVAAYNVSGEYAMVKAAGQLGWLDADRVALETLTSIRRAGADLIITYFAEEVAEQL